MFLKNLSPKLIVAIIFLFALSVRLLYFRYFGIHMGSDTARYVDAARVLIDSHGNPLALINIGQPLYFWLYPIIIAILGGNTALLIGFQILLQAIAAVLVYRAGEIAFNRIIGLIAGFIYALFWEIIQWDVYILTDSIFLFLVVALLYTYLLIVTTGHKKYWFPMIGLLIATMLERPHGFIVVIIFAATLFLRLPRRIKPVVIAFACFIAAFYLLLLDARSVDHNITDYQGVVSKFYSDGVVIDGRPGYNLPVDNGFMSMASIFLHRLVAFWFVYPAEFAFSHKLFNAVFLIPLYIFSLYGAVRFWKESRNNRSIIGLVLLFIALYWFATSLTNVDYDWRLRLPVWPFIILLASYGFVSLHHQIKLPQTNPRIAA
jgi:4-amino-4-deoxy-L-arabinose transferase-like glycosyltransferase